MAAVDLAANAKSSRKLLTCELAGSSFAFCVLSSAGWLAGWRLKLQFWDGEREREAQLKANFRCKVREAAERLAVGRPAARSAPVGSAARLANRNYPFALLT